MRKLAYFVLVLLLAGGCVTGGRSKVVLPEIPRAPAPVQKDAVWVEPSSRHYQTTKLSRWLAPLPPYSVELSGQHEVRFRNPNSTTVLVVIRSGNKGKNVEVEGDSAVTVRLPDGNYRCLVVFASQPNALFRGDYFTLPANKKLDIILPLAAGK